MLTSECSTWPRTTEIEVHLILKARDDAPCTVACAAEKLGKGDAKVSSNGSHGARLILEHLIFGSKPGKNRFSEDELATRPFHVLTSKHDPM